jgi:hypothetical protein
MDVGSGVKKKFDQKPEDEPPRAGVDDLVQRAEDAVKKVEAMAAQMRKEMQSMRAAMDIMTAEMAACRLERAAVAEKNAVKGILRAKLTRRADCAAGGVICKDVCGLG